MTKFNYICDEKTTSTLCMKNTGIRRFYVFGILILSMIAFTTVVDAGCSCSGGTWDPSGFLNSELGTGQTVQPGSAQGNIAGNSGSSTQKPLDRMASFPNGEILKPMKSVSSSDVVLDVSNGDSYAKSHIKMAIQIPTIGFLDGEGNLITLLSKFFLSL
jgi:thiosulfate/3-mercaptopyruvate sulfurtransferase